MLESSKSDEDLLKRRACHIELDKTVVVSGVTEVSYAFEQLG